MLLRALSLAFLAWSPHLFAQSQNGAAIGEAMQALMHTGAKPANDEIFGYCELAGKGDVAFKSPCNGIQIVLKKVGGGEVSRATVNKGEFRFSRLAPGNYQLDVDSEKYKLAKPIEKLETGHTYQISLSQ
jgi:hypothetical protein